MIHDQGKHRNGFPSEWDEILKQVEIRIATGSHRHRLEGIAGLSSSAFTSLLQRGPLSPSWSSDGAKFEKAIAALSEWLANETAKNSGEPAGYAETPTFRTIYNRINGVRLDGGLLAQVGGVGVGKSQPAKAVAADHPRTMSKPGAVYVEFTSSDGNQTAALAKIAEALSGPLSNAYRSWQLESAIGEAYRPGDLLILDECNELSNAAGIIKDLHNRFSWPIVAIGNPDFALSIYGKKSSFSALASRMPCDTYSKTTEAYVYVWFVWAGLCGERLLDVAIAIACRNGPMGGLRSLALLIKECQRAFPGLQINAEMLEQVAAAVGRGIQNKRAA